MDIRLHKNHFWLLVAPVVVTLLDMVVTLAGQPSSYWAGSYSTAVEGAPQGKWLLTAHPVLFIVGILVWIALFGAAILVLPRFFSLVLSLAVTMGHSWGANTWLADLVGYWACIALFIVAAILTVWTWGRSKALG